MAIEIRSEMTSFAMTPTEKEQLKKAAELDGKRLSDFIREAVMNRVRRVMR